MKKLTKLLCKIGIHKYEHKRIESFYPYKNQTFEDERIILQKGSKSITYYDECCYCGKRKNSEHIKLGCCTQLVYKFPKLAPIGFLKEEE